MAVLAIVKKGTAVLHKPSVEVDPKEIDTPEFKALISDMVETMYAAKGVGIAAPQIGVGKRIFIAESPEGPIALINPVFTKRSKKTVAGEEGCLSIPGQFDGVRRFKSVMVKALNAEGKPVSFTAENFFARVLQHELDHLDGLLYVDRVEEQKTGK